MNTNIKELYESNKKEILNAFHNRSTYIDSHTEKTFPMGELVAIEFDDGSIGCTPVRDDNVNERLIYWVILEKDGKYDPDGELVLTRHVISNIVGDPTTVAAAVLHNKDTWGHNIVRTFIHPTYKFI